MNQRNNKLQQIDWISVFLYIILVIMGWLNIYAAVFNEEHQSIFDLSQRYGKQMIWIIAAALLIIAILLIDIKFYSFFSYLIYSISILILISVLVFGTKIHGAKAWIDVGGITLQPAEFAKVATSLALARYIGSFNFNINEFRPVLTLFFLILFPALIILAQNDTGSALVFVAFTIVFFREGLNATFFGFAIALVLIFFVSLIVSQITILVILAIISISAYFYLSRNIRHIATVIAITIVIFSALVLLHHYRIINYKISYLLQIAYFISVLIFISTAFIRKIRFIIPVSLFLFLSVSFSSSVEYIFYNVLEKHQQKRINDLLGIEYDPLGSGFNVNQSKIAIGSGGLTGKGFLNGTQTKYNFVPEQDTDFIFCTVGEEWGFIGSSVVFLLFIWLILRIIQLAERQRSVFSRVYGYCVASIILFHVLINIGMTIGLTPVIGIPLPFFSYGGSSLWAFTVLLFIFLKLDINRTELI